MDVFWLIFNMREALLQYASQHAFLKKSNTFISNSRLKLAKIKQILSNTLRLNF